MSKILHRIELALIWLAVIATCLMMLLTSADAILRYGLNRPIVGAYEVTEKYLVVAAIFFGFTYAYRGGAFIRVTFLVDMLPPPLKAAANYLAYLISLACCGVFLFATVKQAWQAMSDTTTLATVPILAGPAQLFVPIAFLALLVLMLLDLKQVGSGKALLFSQESPTDQS